MRINTKHYQIIHDCEKRYGSIMATPECELRQLQVELNHEGHPDIPIKWTDSNREKFEQMVIQMVDEGYSANTIAGELGAGYSTVKRVIAKYNLTVKGNFRWILTDTVGNIYYATSKGQARKYLLGGAVGGNVDWIERQLVNDGYTIKYRQSIWADISNGDYYITPHGLFLKHGDDSYES
jgi:hypothetical protein